MFDVAVRAAVRINLLRVNSKNAVTKFYIWSTWSIFIEKSKGSLRELLNGIFGYLPFREIPEMKISREIGISESLWILIKGIGNFGKLGYFYTGDFGNFGKSSDFFRELRKYLSIRGIFIPGEFRFFPSLRNRSKILEIYSMIWVL